MYSWTLEGGKRKNGLILWGGDFPSTAASLEGPNLCPGMHMHTSRDAKSHQHARRITSAKALGARATPVHRAPTPWPSLPATPSAETSQMAYFWTGPATEPCGAARGCLTGSGRNPARAERRLWARHPRLLACCISAATLQGEEHHPCSQVQKLRVTRD